MTRTPNLEAMWIMPAQRQREVSFNESMVALDGTVFITAGGIGATLPETSTDGDIILLSDGWVCFYFHGWHSVRARHGWTAWVDALGHAVFWDAKRHVWDRVGVEAMADLLDVNLMDLQDGGLLHFNGPKFGWVVVPQHEAAKSASIGDLADVDTTPIQAAPNVDRVLTYNATTQTWTPIDLREIVQRNAALNDLVDADAHPQTGDVLTRADDGQWRSSKLTQLVPVIPQRLDDFVDVAAASGEDAPQSMDVLIYDQAKSAWTPQHCSVVLTGMRLGGLADLRAPYTGQFSVTDGQTLKKNAATGRWVAADPKAMVPDGPMRKGANLSHANDVSFVPEIPGDGYRAASFRSAYYDTFGFNDGGHGFVIPDGISRVRLTVCGSKNLTYPMPLKIIVSTDGGATWSYLDHQVFWWADKVADVGTSGSEFTIRTPFLNVAPGWKFRCPALGYPENTTLGQWNAVFEIESF